MNPRASHKQAELVTGILAGIESAVARGVPGDAALADLYHNHREFGSRDRRFFSGVVFSYFRWKGWLNSLGVTNPAERCVLAALLDAEEMHPAIQALIETSVTGQSRGGPSGDGAPPPRSCGLSADRLHLSPLGSLSLAEKAERIAAWTGSGTPPIAADLLPGWAPAALHMPAGTDPGDHFRRCVESFQSRPPTWIRIRRRFRAETDRALTAHGVPFETQALLTDARRIPAAAAGLNLALSDLQGKAEIQDLASQVVGLVCNPAPGSTWWDVCAGAMGKTLQLADLMDETGRILATDVRESALSQGHRRIRNAGLSCVEWKTWDLDKDPAPGHLFDGILVDAPCSAIGTWHRNPDARWRTSREDVREKAALQKSLLDAASRKLAKDGALIYATCTLTDMENREVVDDFLRTHPDFAPALFPHPLTGQPASGSIWIWPWAGPCNGMFVAKLGRI